jgi:arylsulfatase A-like enzyme
MNKLQKLRKNSKKWVTFDMKNNVLLIVVDSLRADKFYNEKLTGHTPNIDKLLKNSFNFTNTISSTDGTYSSLGSLFTGKNPFNHNVTWSQNHLNTTESLQELKKNKIKLYATLPNQTFFKNIGNIFDDVDLVDGEPYLRLFEGFGQKILDRLDKINHNESWFYYIHLMDFHTSKKLPDEYNQEKFGKTSWDKRLHVLDSWIGEILQKIDLTKTIVILTADHGEFDVDLDIDHGSMPKFQKFLKSVKLKSPKIIEPMGLAMFVFLREIKRKYIVNKLQTKSLNESEFRKLLTRSKSPLYDDVLKIPFLISTPENFIGSSDQQVRQIDIFPTIFDLLELQLNYPIDGISLKPLLQNLYLSELNAYVESSIDPFTNNEFSIFTGLRTSKFKFIKSHDNLKKSMFLFDLKNDPQEENNIASTSPDIVNQMENLLMKYRKNKSKSFVTDDEQTAKIKEELKKMGYI